MKKDKGELIDDFKMCKTHNPRKIDKCMKGLIQQLNEVLWDEFEIKACCCGHGKIIIVVSFVMGWISGIFLGLSIRNKRENPVKHIK